MFTRPEQKRQRQPPKSGITALVDGDYFPYAVGFAAQHNIHEVTVVGEDTPRASFQYKKELKAWMEQQRLDLSDVNIVTRVEADPVGFALHSVKIALESALEECNAEHCKVYLQGKDNFRDKIATIAPYKGTRPTTKPVHFKAIREYLVQNYGAEIINGMETDDKLSIEQTKDPENTVILTSDKDLNTLMGWKYNLKKSIKYWVSEEDATLWFYCQLIMGDSVDNIQGIPGKGKMAAYKILQNAETEGDMYRAVWQAYHQASKHTSEEETDEQLEENARLLFMVRSKDENGELVMWEAP